MFVGGPGGAGADAASSISRPSTVKLGRGLGDVGLDDGAGDVQEVTGMDFAQRHIGDARVSGGTRVHGVWGVGCGPVCVGGVVDQVEHCGAPAGAQFSAHFPNKTYRGSIRQTRCPVAAGR